MRWVVGLLLLGACIRDDLAHCSDGRLCPAGLACDTFLHTCTTPAEADACAGMQDNDSCSSPLAPIGVCLGGVCQPCTSNSEYCTYEGWTPMASGTSADLYDVWVAGPGDAYVVGSAGTILHYDGTAWAPLAGFPATTQNLIGIWGTTAGELFVVPNDKTVYRFDGVSWTQDQLPQIGSSVWASAGNDVYVVGQSGMIAHFDGASWLSTIGVGPFSGALNEVWGSGKDDVFTVGNGGMTGHYNGTSWSMSIGPTNLYGVGGSGFDNVFVVGGGVPTGNVLTHWDGVAWMAMTIPPAGQVLRAVWAGSHTDAFVASQDGVLLHYDGVAWTTVMETPPPVNMYAIDGTPNGTVYVVGVGGTIWRYASP